jgi:hypothetical protein
MKRKNEVIITVQVEVKIKAVDGSPMDWEWAECLACDNVQIALEAREASDKQNPAYFIAFGEPEPVGRK